MSNIDRAADIIQERMDNVRDEPSYSDDNDDHAREASHDLDRAGLLTPDPQIIPTDDDYEALDPDSLVLDRKGRVTTPTNMWRVPAVVVATGEHVRACREALEGAADG